MLRTFFRKPSTLSSIQVVINNAEFLVSTGEQKAAEKLMVHEIKKHPDSKAMRAA